MSKKQKHTVMVGPAKVDSSWLDNLNGELQELNLETEEVIAESIKTKPIDLPQPKRPKSLPKLASGVILDDNSREHHPSTVIIYDNDEGLTNGTYVSRATFIKQTGLNSNIVYNKLSKENKDNDTSYPVIYRTDLSKSQTYYKKSELDKYFSEELKDLKNKKHTDNTEPESTHSDQPTNTQLVIKLPNTNGKSLRTLKHLAGKFGISEDLMTSLALGVDSFPRFVSFSSQGEPLYDSEIISDYLKINNIINDDNSLAICTLEEFGEKIHKSIMGSCKVKPVLVVEDTEEYFSKVDLVQWLLTSDPSMISRLF